MMSANSKVSRPKRLCTIKNRVRGGWKPKGRNIKRPNSIGRLNDFCLLQIFNRLDLKDLLNLTDVNKQFKRVSQMTFAGRYPKFTYTWHRESERPQIRRVLCKFGLSIKSLEYRDCQSTEFEAIPKFCAGGTLNELHLSMTNIMKYNDGSRLLFSSLKTLTLSHCNHNGRAGALLSECQELKTLRLHSSLIRMRFISDVAQKYSKLEELYICGFNYHTTRALLKLNPQIKKLEMCCIPSASFSMISKMVHLEELVIRSMRGVSRYINISKLAALKSLKVLELESVHTKVVAAIVGAMENVHSLDRFQCDGYYRDWQFTNQINKLKTLKSLALNVSGMPLADLFAELGGQFPLIRELELRFNEDENNAPRSMGDLIRYIELSTTLEVFTIRTERPEPFNQHFYDKLMEVIQRRQSSKTFKVTVYCHPSLPTTINMHSNLLQVEFITHWYK